MGANCEVHSHLKQTMNDKLDVGAFERSFKTGGVKKRLNPDLSVCNKRMRTEVEMLRVVNEHELEGLRGGIGQHFAGAVAKPVSTRKVTVRTNCSATVQLCDQDIVRIVTCDSEDRDTDKRKDTAVCSSSNGIGTEATEEPPDPLRHARLCPHPGIDLEHSESEIGLTDLHLNLKFKKLLGCSGTVRKAQKGARAKVDKGTDEFEASIGNVLECKSSVCKVTSIDDSKCKVRCAVCGHKSDGAAVSLDKSLAADLVCQHNSKQ